MDAYGGFIFTCSSEDEIETLTPYVKNHHFCSVTMNNQELQLGIIELCLFSLDHKNIHYAALMRRSREVASARYCLKFLKFINIHAIPLSGLIPIFSNYSVQTNLFSSDTDSNIEGYLLSTLHRTGKRVQPQIWQAIISHLKDHSASQAQELDDLERIRRLSHQRYSSVGINILKQEKDAALLALKLFGADHENILTSWFAQDESSDIYLQGLEGYHKVREDDTLINDILQSASKIAGAPIQNIRSSIKGLVRVPRNNGQVITIVNANRNKIEDTTGADLVYYNHAYHSHVLVQYKMMEIDTKETAEPKQTLTPPKRQRAPKPNKKKEFCYRPDKKFTEQVERMKKLQSLAVKEENSENTLGYRLNNNGFFFKLCESFEFEPMSSDLAQGLYLPLDYMEQLLQSPNTTGPRGGKSITHANAGRNFSNTLFMDLLREGLIGSAPNASKVIYDEIHNSLSEGRSLTLAWEDL